MSLTPVQQEVQLDFATKYKTSKPWKIPTTFSLCVIRAARMYVRTYPFHPSLIQTGVRTGWLTSHFMTTAARFLLIPSSHSDLCSFSLRHKGSHRLSPTTRSLNINVWMPCTRNCNGIWFSVCFVYSSYRNTTGYHFNHLSLVRQTVPVSIIKIDLYIALYQTFNYTLLQISCLTN